MKKKKLIFLTVILIMLTSCMIKNNGHNNKENLNLIDKSQEFSEEINDGSYKKENFYSAFTPEAQKNIDKNNLYQFIDHFKTITGPRLKVDKVQVTEQSVLLVLDNENRKSSEVYTYDNTGHLTNFAMFPGEINHESNKYYSIEPIELQRESMIIPGALTMPKNVEKPKIAILVTGLGPHDMDETIGLSGNKPFKDIATGLAKNGIATLRYDKSILHGNQRNSINDEYVDDFNAAYEYVQSLNNVDKDNIYIIAHDTGASLAPLLAQGKSIKGIVLMAGSLRNIADIIYDQTEAVVNESNGLSEKDKKEQLNKTVQEVHDAKTITKDSKRMPFGINASYWSSFNSIDLKKELLNYPGRMLILQGNNDFETVPEKNYYEYQEVLNNRNNVSYKLFDGLSHIFTPSDDKSFNMGVYDAPQNVRGDVIFEITKWMNFKEEK